VAVGALNVRQRPGKSAVRLGVLGEGEQVEVFGNEGVWLRVLYGGQVAYVYGAFVRFTPQPAQTRAAAPEAPASAAGAPDGETDWLQSTYSTAAAWGAGALGSVVDAAEGFWERVTGLFDQERAEQDSTEVPVAGAGGLGSTGGATANELDALMAQERLSVEELARARELIAEEPDAARRGELFEALQGKVEYHSQRDNESKEKSKGKEQRIGDRMCNLTSLAMCLSYLGVPNPYPDLQYEDALEKLRVEKGLGARTPAEPWASSTRSSPGTCRAARSGTPRMWNRTCVPAGR
jgi:hypothetical protein